MDRLFNRRKSGLGSLELSLSVILFVVILMICLDIGVVMLANGTLDRAARDAGRAAAQQETVDNSIKAAKAALISHKTDGYWVTQPVLSGTSPPDFVYRDFGGDPTRGNPTVTVTTRCTVRLPIPIDFLGQKLVTIGSGGPGTIDFRRTYTFPIVRFKLDDQFR